LELLIFINLSLGSLILNAAIFNGGKA
jgi:hypothetical protein